MRPAWALLVAMSLYWTGCNATLPEPESEGAQLYASHCNSCHRVYAPKSMTYEMWKVQVERMQGELVRHGLPPLTERERTVVLDYLKRHSS
jgi:mono/diheme cytochrome c family protein